MDKNKYLEVINAIAEYIELRGYNPSIRDVIDVLNILTESHLEVNKHGRSGS